jgi:RHS repeat-associated protein
MQQLASRNTSALGGPIGTVHYIYDTQGHLIAEADAATGATMREYLWLPSNDNRNDTMAEDMGLAANDNAPVDLPLAVVDVAATPVVYQVHTDHLGRPIRMTDAAKSTIWQATWKPWGEVQSITGAVAQNLRFPRQYFQLETGLAYNWHRTYDPVTGRYTQPDPLRFVDGPSVYAYAGSSPYILTDRQGLNNVCGAGHSNLPGGILIPGCNGLPGEGGGGGLTGGAAGAAAGLATAELLRELGKGIYAWCTSCPPCKTVSGKIIPVGTIAYRPLDTPTRPQHGIVGPHFNIYKANQIPAGVAGGRACMCFWSPVGAVTPADLPAGAIPIEAFQH